LRRFISWFSVFEVVFPVRFRYSWQDNCLLWFLCWFRFSFESLWLIVAWFWVYSGLGNQKIRGGLQWGNPTRPRMLVTRFLASRFGLDRLPSSAFFKPDRSSMVSGPLKQMKTERESPGGPPLAGFLWGITLGFLGGDPPGGSKTYRYTTQWKGLGFPARHGV
jgi:hypothetical protein